MVRILRFVVTLIDEEMSSLLILRFVREWNIVGKSSGLGISRHSFRHNFGLALRTRGLSPEKNITPSHERPSELKRRMPISLRFSPTFENFVSFPSTLKA